MNIVLILQNHPMRIIDIFYSVLIGWQNHQMRTIDIFYAVFWLTWQNHPMRTIDIFYTVFWLTDKIIQWEQLIYSIQCSDWLTKSSNENNWYILYSVLIGWQNHPMRTIDILYTVFWLTVFQGRVQKSCSKMFYGCKAKAAIKVLIL